MLFALVGALEASISQILRLSVLFLLFMLLDLSLFPKLLRGLRISLAFFAGYWIFASLFGAHFPDMVLFTLKLVLFIIVTVYVLGNLSLQQVLQDTRGIRKIKWGERLMHFMIATSLFLRAYGRYFARHKPKLSRRIGETLDEMIAAGAHVFGSTNVIEAQLQRTMNQPNSATSPASANLIALCLLALVVLVTSL